MRDGERYKQSFVLIWNFRLCQSSPPHDVDACILDKMKLVHHDLGFYAFLSEITISGAPPIRRFFLPGSRDEAVLRTALEDALERLDQQSCSGANDFCFLDPNESKPIETSRLGEKRILRALAVTTTQPDGPPQSLPLRMAILVDADEDEDAPAFTAGSGYWVPLAAEIDAALHARDSMFLHFPPAFSEHLWHSAHGGCKRANIANGNDNEKPPGVLDRNSKLDTVTLSLDLRQSTFAMEKVVSRDDYSDWMERLLKVYRTLIYHYHGVFDKFTGDGVLAHFLKAKDLPGGPTTETQARRGAQCAMDMVVVTDLFYERLQPILRVDSKLFGAGVGIAADYASWSMDGARNPMVVGHGVVDACRLCARAQAGETLITVNAYHRLCSGSTTLETGAEKVEFAGKNYPDEMDLMVWRLRSCGPNFTERHEQLKAIVNEELKGFPKYSNGDPRAS